MEIIRIDTKNLLEAFLGHLMDFIETHTILIFLRTTDVEILINNIIALKAGISVTDIQNGTLSPDEFKKFTKASTWIEEQKTFFSYFDFTELDSKKEEIDRAMEETSPDIVYVDKDGLDDETLECITNYLDQRG